MTRRPAPETPSTVPPTDKPKKAERPRFLKRNPHSFRKQEIPPDVPRGFFTLFIDDDQGQHVSQVWAATPGSAASLMAPWAKRRLRRARKHEEVPVELVGWDNPSDPAELAAETGIPENELDPGFPYGIELSHVWLAEHEDEDKKWSLYVIETIPYDFGVTDERWA